MKNILYIFLFIYSTSIYPLEVQRIKNIDLKDLCIYKGSRKLVFPEDGVILYIKGKANKVVKLYIKKNNLLYLAQGVRIENLRARQSIITLDKFGEGKFEIGFSLVGEKKVSGKHEKQIKYKIEYL